MKIESCTSRRATQDTSNQLRDIWLTLKPTLLSVVGVTSVIGNGYEAELLSESPLLLPMTEEDDESLSPEPWMPMSGGTDSLTPNNEDYLKGLDAMEAQKDVAWIHAVGANTLAQWTVIALHCSEMASDHLAERFALVETPEFETTGEVGSAQYLADLDSYRDQLINMMRTVGDKNIVPIAGSAKFMDPDGSEHIRPLAASVGGTVAGLTLHKLWLNKAISNVVKSDIAEDSLWPAWRDTDIAALKRARINTVEVNDGVGYVISDNLTGASEGSDYSQANELRVTYTIVKDVRRAMNAFFGEDTPTKIARCLSGQTSLNFIMAKSNSPLLQMKQVISSLKRII